MAYAVIRIRGHAGVNKDIEDTMQMLHLTRINHCVVLPQTDIIRGMLYKMKDYVTWGEVSAETLARMIKFKGALAGGGLVDDAYIKERSKFTSIISLAKAVVKDEFQYAKLEGAKPLFRLAPPRKGYEGNKKSFRDGGALGYRGDKINDLIARML